MSAYLDDGDLRLYQGDSLAVLRTLPDESIDCCVTSPPYYGLRDYGTGEAQIGLEDTPDAYVARLVDVFREVRRVLRPHGSLWLNLGDSYAGSWGARGRSDDTNAPRPDLVEKYGTAAPMRHPPDGIKPKDLLGIPWLVAFALRADGWYLRSDVVWAKPNPMPESVRDRPTKAHEYVFLLTKGPRYYFDQEAVREADSGRPSGNVARKVADGRDGHRPADHMGSSVPWEPTGTGRNVRSVWTIATQPFPEAHFATFPEELPRRCIAAGCPHEGTVLDPFLGSGTTALVARKLGRRCVGIDLSADYLEIAARRTQQLSLLGGAA